MTNKIYVNLDNSKEIDSWYENYISSIVKPEHLYEQQVLGFLEFQTVLTKAQMEQNAHILQKLDTLIALSQPKKKKKKSDE